MSFCHHQFFAREDLDAGRVVFADPAGNVVGKGWRDEVLSRYARPVGAEYVFGCTVSNSVFLFDCLQLRRAEAYLGGLPGPDGRYTREKYLNDVRRAFGGLDFCSDGAYARRFGGDVRLRVLPGKLPGRVQGAEGRVFGSFQGVRARRDVRQGQGGREGDRRRMLAPSGLEGRLRPGVLRPGVFFVAYGRIPEIRARCARAEVDDMLSRRPRLKPVRGSGIMEGVSEERTTGGGVFTEFRKSAKEERQTCCSK